ncbi:MAG: pitrilysin family protein [Clostridium sp.]
MKEYILSNGVKLIYKKGASELASICIGLDAGAAVEDELLGLAHATEHMVYKGTKSRSEGEINEALSKVFGFHNAMTNYPYVIYYGTLLGEDLEAGIEIFSDILINPIFPNQGFREEMDVIMEELKEWDEELEQFCEDKLFFNFFKNNRLKYPIIGRDKDLEKIKLEDLKEFYNKYYSPENTCISVVSSLEFEEVISKIDKYFGVWKGNSKAVSKVSLELPNTGLFEDCRDGINTSKVQIIAPIASLTNEELKALRLFNSYFGEGVNSILFDTLRTKNGLVYDVLTRVAFEKHIGIYKITFSTSKDKAMTAINLIKECISHLDNHIEILTEKKIDELCKGIRLKKLFREEQTIQLAKELSTYEVMFGDYKLYDNMLDGMSSLSGSFIINVAKKVLSNISIEIIS